MKLLPRGVTNPAKVVALMTVWPSFLNARLEGTVIVLDLRPGMVLDATTDRHPDIGRVWTTRPRMLFDDAEEEAIFGVAARMIPSVLMDMPLGWHGPKTPVPDGAKPELVASALSYAAYLYFEDLLERDDLPDDERAFAEQRMDDLIPPDARANLDDGDS